MIGLDFDNTIAGYDKVFSRAAVCEGLLSPSEANSKREVRDALRQHPDGEREWMRLQGRAYGAHMDEATLIEGVAEFLTTCRNNDISICIVSHKTEFGHFDPDRISLRDAARTWMSANGFFDSDLFGLTADMVFFEATRKEKVCRIAKLGCTHFVDDLEEVFLESGFPDKTKRYLFTNGVTPLPAGPFRAFSNWSEIMHDIFNA